MDYNHRNHLIKKIIVKTINQLFTNCLDYNFGDLCDYYDGDRSIKKIAKSPLLL